MVNYLTYIWYLGYQATRISQIRRIAENVTQLLNPWISPHCCTPVTSVRISDLRILCFEFMRPTKDLRVS